jgi:hypothetical protein
MIPSIWTLYNISTSSSKPEKHKGEGLANSLKVLYHNRIRWFLELMNAAALRHSRYSRGICVFSWCRLVASSFVLPSLTLAYCARLSITTSYWLVDFLGDDSLQGRVHGQPPRKKMGWQIQLPCAHSHGWNAICSCVDVILMCDSSVSNGPSVNGNLPTIALELLTTNSLIMTSNLHGSHTDLEWYFYFFYFKFLLIS